MRTSLKRILFVVSGCLLGVLVGILIGAYLGNDEIMQELKGERSKVPAIGSAEFFVRGDYVCVKVTSPRWKDTLIDCQAVDTLGLSTGGIRE